MMWIISPQDTPRKRILQSVKVIGPLPRIIWVPLLKLTELIMSRYKQIHNFLFFFREWLFHHSTV